MSERIWTSSTSTDSEPRSSARWPGPPGRSRPAPAPLRSSPQDPGHDVGSVGEVVQQRCVGRRDMDLAVRVDGDPTNEHPGAAHRPVQRFDELGDAADLLLVLALERRRGDDRQPLVGRALQLAQRRLGGAAPDARTRAARWTSPSRVHWAASRNSVEMVRTTTAAWVRGRRSGAAGTTAAATRATAPPMTASNHRVNASPGVATKATTKIDCTAAWVTSSPPASRNSAADMATRTMTPICHAPVADQHKEQVGDEQADRDADGDLRDPTQALRVVVPETDDRDDRREHRCLVVEHAVARNQASAAAMAHWPMCHALARTRSTGSAPRPGHGARRGPRARRSDGPPRPCSCRRSFHRGCGRCVGRVPGQPGPQRVPDRPRGGGGGTGAGAGLRDHDDDRIPRVRDRAERGEPARRLLAVHLGGPGLAGQRVLRLRPAGEDPTRRARRHDPLQRPDEEPADLGRQRHGPEATGGIGVRPTRPGSASPRPPAGPRASRRWPPPHTPARAAAG